MAKPIFYTKKFKKNYKKRFSHKAKIKQQISYRIELFIEKRNSPQIRDHALVGTKNGERAFSITGDIRIIYYELEDRFVFIDIGRHSQVY